MCFNYCQALPLHCPVRQYHKSATESCVEFLAVGQRLQSQSPDLRRAGSLSHHFPHHQKGQMDTNCGIRKITLLRVIPTMAFNSSHLTVYLAYLSGNQSGMSSDILSYLAYLLTFYLAVLTFHLAFYLAFSLAFYMALFAAVEVRLKSGEAHSAQTLAS